jgi:hypothetical protein
MNEKQQSKSKQPTRKCRICGKPVAEDAPTFPFCGPRCRTIDLGRWADESYKITRPIEQSDLDEE